MTEQSGQTAVLTGAAGGMGRAITKALLESGRRVVLVDRDAKALQELAATAGNAVFPIQLDISDAEAVNRLSEAIPAQFKPVDILINNAGHDIGGRTRFDAGSADDWSNIIQTNLIGLMRVTRAILPDMVRRNSGHVVNISSINAVRIVPDMAAYSTSKAGVHMFTETLRGELAETAIRVTELQPGLTRTNIILTRYRGDKQKERDYFDQFKLALEPADIARSIVFALDQPAHVQIAEMMILPVKPVLTFPNQDPDMERRSELQSTLRIEDVPTVRAMVAQKLREAIMSGTLKPGQRLVERELCEMMGVSRPSIREALRALEADGLINMVPHRGPVVSTISLEEARQLYAARAVLEGFAGRECARLHDPEVTRRIGEALTRLKAAAAKQDLIGCLEAKTDFYGALIGGCRNAFIQRMLRPLHDRIQLLRITSMSQPKRINKSLREVTAIWRAIQSGDADLAERCCVDHINAAAVAALDMIEKSSAAKEAAPTDD